MGNSITSSSKQQMLLTLNTIFNSSYPELDLEDRVSDYIDFINPDELKDNNVMGGKSSPSGLQHSASGIDSYERRFIVFKSHITINNTSTNMFTTFFQRYNDNDILYHCASQSYRDLLFNTEGGATLKQMEFLLELLNNRVITLNYEQACDFKLNYNLDQFTDDEKNKLSINITLGFTDIPTKAIVR